MICEIIFFKTMYGIFLVFCRSRFSDNFVVNNFAFFTSAEALI